MFSIYQYLILEKNTITMFVMLLLKCITPHKNDVNVYIVL